MMQLRLLYSILLGTAVCAALPASADVWVGHGPNQGIYALAIDPAVSSRVYAGGDSGSVFASTDAGTTWTPMSNGLPSARVMALAIDPTSTTTIYAGTLGSGVYKTTDAGASWSSANLTGNVAALAIDAYNPFAPTTVYAGTAGVGVYKTTDGGLSWPQINTNLSSTAINSLLVDPTSKVFASTEGGGAFKSANGGFSWSPINDSVGDEFVVLPNSVRAMAVDPTNPATVYAGTAKGVYRSFNTSGHNWKAINLGLTTLSVVSLAIDPVDGNVLYAGTDGGGIFKTSMAVSEVGVTLEIADPKNILWNPINTGLTDHNVKALVISPTDANAIYTGTATAGFFADTQLCSSQPLAGCVGTFQANKSVLTIKDKANNKMDTQLWKWMKGKAVNVADFGNPLTGGTYSLCVYDESGNTPQLLLGATAAGGEICAGKTPKPCWKANKTGFTYKNALRVADGFDSITLKAGADGKSQIVASLKGVSLTMPTLPLNLPVHVQFQASNGQCWETHFSTFRKNQIDQFDARSD